jgi:hypothetical protein
LSCANRLGFLIIDLPLREGKLFEALGRERRRLTSGLKASCERSSPSINL